ncbi:MAG: hypothetical protein WKF97_23240 [Chitinophagaceae bacterium]
MNYKKYKFASLFSLILFLIGSEHEVLGQNSKMAAPNIIFIIADDVSWNNIGCMVTRQYEHQTLTNSPGRESGSIMLS